MIDQTMLEANIIEVLGIGDLSDEKKAAILNQAIDLVQKNLMLRLVKDLSDEDRADFYKLLDEPSKAAELAAFMSSHFPNIAEMVQEEIVKVKADLKAVAEKVGP